MRGEWDSWKTNNREEFKNMPRHEFGKGGKGLYARGQLHSQNGIERMTDELKDLNLGNEESIMRHV